MTTGNPNVVVQVIDTGVELDHDDLQLNIWTNDGEICNNNVDDDGNGYVDDCHGYNHADDTGTDLLGTHWHGTHCAGTVAADSNNGVGVRGGELLVPSRMRRLRGGVAATPRGRDVDIPRATEREEAPETVSR